MIEEDTQEEIEDKCGYRCSQYFNGTNAFSSHSCFKGNCNNIVYSLYDLGVSKEGYVDFLNHNCYYSSSSKKRTKEFNQIKNTITSKETTTCFSDSQKKTTIAEELIYNIDHLDYDTFMRFFRHKFKYIYRQEKEEWIEQAFV